MSNYSGDSLLQFPLSATGNVAPSTTISSDGDGSLDGAADAVFNGAGDLWVANESAIVEFTPSQLASTGKPVARRRDPECG